MSSVVLCSPMASEISRLMKPFTVSPFASAKNWIFSFWPLGTRSRMSSYALALYLSLDALEVFPISFTSSVIIYHFAWWYQYAKSLIFRAICCEFCQLIYWYLYAILRPSRGNTPSNSLQRSNPICLPSKSLQKSRLSVRLKPS